MAKHVRIILIFSILGVLFYTYLYYSENGTTPALAEQFWLIIGIVFFANITGYIIRFLNTLLDKIIAWNDNFGARFGLSLIINIITIPVGALLFFFTLQSILELDLALREYINEHLEVSLRLLVLSITFGFIYTIIDFSFFSYNHYSVIQIETERQIRKQVELQYEALKTQLSPHYLFNSLNTISLLIYKDPDLTEEFIRKLAKTYEYILKSNEKKLITIKEELEFIKAYAYSLKVRYEEGFQLSLDISNHLESYFIPPLSLQILVENAVKHNVISNEEPLHIQIRNQRLNLIVENNILKKPNTNHSFKIGHSNIKKRYQYFTNKKVHITKSKTYQVSIPVLA